MEGKAASAGLWRGLTCEELREWASGTGALLLLLLLLLQQQRVAVSA